MSEVVAAAAVGAIGALIGAFLGIWLGPRSESRQRRKTVASALRAQIEFAEERVRRFKSGGNVGWRTGQPFFKALAGDLGCLKPAEASAATKALLGYFELAYTDDDKFRSDGAEHVLRAYSHALNALP